jgi:acyl-CoA thioesterase-1
MRTLLILLCLWCGASLGAEPSILVMGDSLSASYGVPAGQGWVALMQQRLRDQGYPHRVVNASVSGETTAGGWSRLPAALDRNHPSIVLIELGGNDGLRGLPVPTMRKNLDAMIAASRKAGARVALFAVRLPPNYGTDYVASFERAYPELAAADQVVLVPFFLAPLVDDAAAFQEDGIHPTAASQPKLLDAAWPSIKILLDAASARPARP